MGLWMVITYITQNQCMHVLADIHTETGSLLGGGAYDQSSKQPAQMDGRSHWLGEYTVRPGTILLPKRCYQQSSVACI